MQYHFLSRLVVHRQAVHWVRCWVYINKLFSSHFHSLSYPSYRVSCEWEFLLAWIMPFSFPLEPTVIPVPMEFPWVFPLRCRRAHAYQRTARPRPWTTKWRLIVLRWNGGRSNSCGSGSAIWRPPDCESQRSGCGRERERERELPGRPTTLLQTALRCAALCGL